MSNQVEFYIQTEGAGMSAEGAIADAIGKSPDLPFEEGAVIEVHVESAWTDSEGHHHAKVSAVKYVDPILKAHKKNPNKHFEDAEEARKYVDSNEPSDYKGDTEDASVIAMHAMKEVQDADDELVRLNSRHVEAPEPDIDNSPEAIFGALHQDPDKEEKREIRTDPDLVDVANDTIDLHIPRDDLTTPIEESETFDLPPSMQVAEEEFEDNFAHAVNEVSDKKKKAEKELQVAAEHTVDASLPAPQPGGTQEEKAS